VLSIGDDLEILAQLPDDYFDWVYLDTSHQYDHTLQELGLLKEKVRPGGVVMGDDWIVDPADVNHGCSVAVKEFCDAEGWQLGPIDADFLQWRITAPGSAGPAMGTKARR
jgi:predicted O-methyltransferase YrrM